MASIERYQARPVWPPAPPGERQAVALHRLAGEGARRGHTVELTTVTIRPTTVAAAPRVAGARPVPGVRYRQPDRRRGSAVAVAVATVGMLAGLAGLGYWFAALAVGWAVLKAVAGVLGGAGVLLAVATLLRSRCPGVWVHCGGCE